MSRIPAEWILPYYAQVDGGEKQQWVGTCNACHVKFYGEHARDMHLRSPKHQAMIRKWNSACRMAHADIPPMINFVA